MGHRTEHQRKYGRDIPARYLCEQCQENLPASYMLTDELWLSIAQQRELLCHNCITFRLKRPLTIHDFPPDLPINEAILLGYAIAVKVCAKIAENVAQQHSNLALDCGCHWVIDDLADTIRGTT